MWELSFDEHGGLTGPAPLDEITDLDDLFVFSHGWGTAVDSARDLYADMFPLITAAAAGQPRLGRIGFVGVLWPSLWFPPTPATPPPGTGAQQAAGAVTEASSGSDALTGAQITEALLPGFTGTDQRNALRELGRLIDEGSAAVLPDATARAVVAGIRAQLAVLAAPSPAPEDDGETPLLQTDDPVATYQQVAEIFGTAPPTGQQGLGNWLHKAVNGAKDVARVFSYNTMKSRAGVIGSTGLAPVLTALRQRAPSLRVHLVGHSFGARLVSFALAGIPSPAQSPVASLTLLQAAFSHWSFAHAQDNPFGEDGALHNFADRVHGPLVATFSSFDWAVGLWYPKASFLSGEDTEAVVADRWGALGADGFQAVSPVASPAMPGPYSLTPRTFHRVDANAVINDTRGQPFAGAHSDIRKPEVAALIAAAAGAHA